MDFTFNDFMNLLDHGFAYLDQETIGGQKVRIFYSTESADFTQPFANDACGVMFNIDDIDEPKMMCLPRGRASVVDNDDIEYYTEKFDGQVISTYFDNGFIMAKTEKGLREDGAFFLESFLLSYENAELNEIVQDLTKQGFTFTFEYMGPNLSRTICSLERKAVILAIRDNDTGEYVPYKEIFKNAVLRRYLPEQVDESHLYLAIAGITKHGADGSYEDVWSSYYYSLVDLRKIIADDRLLYELIVYNEVNDIKHVFECDGIPTRIQTFEQNFLTFLRVILPELEELYKQVYYLDLPQYRSKSYTYFVQKKKNYMIEFIDMQYGKSFTDQAAIALLGQVFLKNFKVIV